MKNKPNWSNWEIAFLVMIVVPNVLHSRPIDAAHARNSLIFRVVVMAVGVIGLIVAEVLKWRAKAAETARPQTESIPRPPGAP